jgi:hypothetical protein
LKPSVSLAGKKPFSFFINDSCKKHDNLCLKVKLANILLES